jgi:flagellar motor component MotA
MPRAPYQPDRNKYHIHYGRGLPVFHGEMVQSGYGLGNLLSGLFRSALPILTKTVLPALKRTAVPILKRTAKHVGKSLLKSGGKVLSDVIVHKQNLKKSLRERGGQSLQELSHSIPQSFINQPTKRKKTTKRSKTVRKRFKKSDIFD